LWSSIERAHLEDVQKRIRELTAGVPAEGLYDYIEDHR
jgi:hypothetical protein